MFTAQKVEVFEKLRELDGLRESWIKRTIITIDLSEGLDTYVEKATYDISFCENSPIGMDASLDLSCQSLSSGHIAPDCREKDRSAEVYLIPLAWRPRAAFLDLDCIDANGRSMQLVKLKVREEYCEWLFWTRCAELGLCSKDSVSDRIASLLRDHMQNGIVVKPDLKSFSAEEKRLWEEIENNGELSRLYRKICDLQPLILWTLDPKAALLLKIKERKALVKPDRREAHTALKGAFRGTLSSARADCTKIIAPPDMRLKKVDGLVIYGESFQPPRLEAELHGDGSWAFCKTAERGILTEWRLELTSRRSLLISPGRHLLEIGLLACLFWSVKNSPLSDAKEILSSFSMTFVGSVYLYHLYLFGRKADKSFLFNWAVSKQRLLLFLSLMCVIFFQFTAHALSELENVCDSYFLSDVAWSWMTAGYEWSKRVLKALFSHRVENFQRYALLVFIGLTYLDYLYAGWYGRPKRRVNRRRLSPRATSSVLS